MRRRNIGWIVAPRLEKRVLEMSQESMVRTFAPWIGANYWSEGLAGVRVLILGESHYGDADTERSSFTTEIVREWGQEKRLRFFTMIQKLLLGHGPGWISDEARAEFWEQVAFYNFVQAFVGTEPRTRPTREMWDAARMPFLATLAELQPQVLVVLGLELATNLPQVPPSIFVCKVPHPSSNGFSYQQWHPDVLSALQSAISQSHDQQGDSYGQS